VSSAPEQPSASPAARTGEDSAAYQRQASYQQQAPGYPAAEPAARYAEPELGAGAWTGRVLAGVLMLISGVITFLTGLAGVTHSGWFVSVSGTYPYHWTVHNWGWTELVLGAVVVAAGMCVFLGMLWARIVGVVLAVLSAVGSFMFIPFYPLWSIIIIGIDVFVIWALMTTGRRRYTA